MVEVIAGLIVCLVSVTILVHYISTHLFAGYISTPTKTSSAYRSWKFFLQMGDMLCKWFSSLHFCTMESFSFQYGEMLYVARRCTKCNKCFVHGKGGWVQCKAEVIDFFLGRFDKVLEK